MQEGGRERGREREREGGRERERERETEREREVCQRTVDERGSVLDFSCGFRQYSSEVQLRQCGPGAVSIRAPSNSDYIVCTQASSEVRSRADFHSTAYTCRLEAQPVPLAL